MRRDKLIQCGTLGLIGGVLGWPARAAAASPATVFNVKASPYNATGNGTTDDTAAITAANNAALPGDTVFFPRGTYLTSSTFKLRAGIRYEGESRESSIIKQKNGANLGAVCASETWLSTYVPPVFSDAAIGVRHLGIDGNKANQTSGLGIGIASLGYFCQFEDLTISNTRGHGLMPTTKRSNGDVGSSGVVSQIRGCYIVGTGGRGIYVEDPSHNKATDGFIKDCLVESVGSDAIALDSGAGWLIDGNHTYGTPGNGIIVGRAAATRVTNNYIEPFGTAPGGYFGGISLGDNINSWIGDLAPSVVSGNTILVASGGARSTLYGVQAAVSNGITGNVLITGNAMLDYSGLWTAIHLVNQSASASTFATLAANHAHGFAAILDAQANGGVMSVVGP